MIRDEGRFSFSAPSLHPRHEIDTASVVRGAGTARLSSNRHSLGGEWPCKGGRKCLNQSTKQKVN